VSCPLVPRPDSDRPGVSSLGVMSRQLEATAISGETDPRAAARFFLEKGVGTVVVTLGPEGAIALGKGPDGRGLEIVQPCRQVQVRHTVWCLPLRGWGPGDAAKAANPVRAPAVWSGRGADLWAIGVRVVE
jgi:hypothetical protein